MHLTRSGRQLGSNKRPTCCLLGANGDDDDDDDYSNAKATADDDDDDGGHISFHCHRHSSAYLGRCLEGIISLG